MKTISKLTSLVIVCCSTCAVAQTEPSRVVRLTPQDEACSNAMEKLDAARKSLMTPHPASAALANYVKEYDRDPTAPNAQQKLTNYYAAALIAMKQQSVEYLEAHRVAKEALSAYIETLDAEEAAIDQKIATNSKEFERRKNKVREYRDRLGELSANLVPETIEQMSGGDMHVVLNVIQQAEFAETYARRSQQDLVRDHQKKDDHSVRATRAEQRQFRDDFDSREVAHRLEIIEEELLRIYEDNVQTFRKTNETLANAEKKPLSMRTVDDVLVMGGRTGVSRSNLIDVQNDVADDLTARLLSAVKKSRDYGKSILKSEEKNK